jgi:hypothetical protein
MATFRLDSNVPHGKCFTYDETKRVRKSCAAQQLVKDGKAPNGWSVSKTDKAIEVALARLGDRIREIEDPDGLAFAAAEILGRELEVSRAGYGNIDVAKETHEHRCRQALRSVRITCPRRFTPAGFSLNPKKELKIKRAAN